MNDFENYLLGNSAILLNNKSLENAINNKVAEYRQYGVELTSYDAKEEVFADVVGRLFEDDGAIQHLYKSDRNLFQRVYDWIVHTISKIGKDADTKLLMDAQRKFVLAMQESSGVLRENAGNSPMASYVGTDASGIRHYKSDLIGYSEDDRKWFFNTYFQDHFNGAEVELDGVHGEIKVKANRKSINKNLYSGNAAEKTKFPFDLVDILENAKLNDIEKEPSYFDPNIEPKNDAHRNTKYWHRYKSIVNLDGADYEITFSVAEKADGSFKFYYAGMQKASILTGSLNDRHRRILASKDSIDENQFKVNPILENNSSDVFSMADSLDIDGNSTPLHLRNDGELYSFGDGTTPPMNFEYGIDNPNRIENSKWESGQLEKKKNNSNARRNRRHRDFVCWDYFKTTVFVDGKPFDIRVNVVTDKHGDKNLYQVLAHKNRKGITADPLISQVSSNSVIPFRSTTSVPQGTQSVNTQNQNGSCQVVVEFFY
ncbi:MAG: hypothetical protein Q4D65_10600 [Peptostreptococcaceae bacterium]|nr:hypothetical protein [Peptostreptococcaceae bacterium]